MFALVFLFLYHLINRFKKKWIAAIVSVVEVLKQLCS